MTGEELERAMEFILNQQAKNSVAIETLTERVDALTEDVKALKEVTAMQMQSLEVVAAALERLGEHQAQTNQNVREMSRRLTDQSERLREDQAQTNQTVRAMSDKLTVVAEKLDAFVTVFERYIASNGKA